MRRAERLFRVVDEMRTRDVVRAEDLARQMECSVSTIYRDIAHLQGSGLPIEGEAGVGYMLRPGFDLPPVTFTHDQLDALAVGLSFVERAGDPALAIAAREARAKLQAGLPQPEERVLADAPYRSLQHRDAASHEGAVLRQAIRKRQVVRLSYRDAAGAGSAREVEPLVIWTLTDGWMFSGWCRLRQDFRTFRFDGIDGLEVTGARYEAHPERNLQAFLAMETCEAERPKAPMLT